MKFQKGRSGNPAGKPCGARDKRTELRRLLEPSQRKLVKKAIALALAGDTTALKLCLDRLQAPLRPRDDVVSVKFKGASLTERADSIFAAIAAGHLSPEQGSRLLDALAACARIREVDELEKRLAALEELSKGQQA